MGPIGDGGMPTWTLTIKVMLGVDQSTEEKGGTGTTEPLVKEVSSEESVAAKKEVNYTSFHHIFASNPFGTRTHVFTRVDPVKVGDSVGRFAVVKDQLCREGTRSPEHDILKRIHRPQTVPGVVEAVFHEIVQLPPKVVALNIGRDKHRHGLRQLGTPFGEIPAVKEMLQTAYDIIEGDGVIFYLDRISR
jgi:hypothetical protein